jgi:hypothetical protein
MNLYAGRSSNSDTSINICVQEMSVAYGEVVSIGVQSFQLREDT